MIPYKRLFTEDQIVEYQATFDIGDTTYEVDVEGLYEPAQRGHRELPSYSESLTANIKGVRPLSIKDLVDADLDDLHLNWDMLWLDGTFSAVNIPDYLKVWDTRAVEALAKELKNHLQGLQELSDGDAIAKAFLDNEKSPSDYLDRLRAAYFPMGGLKAGKDELKAIEDNYFG
jgi:hypothetical protein